MGYDRAAIARFDADEREREADWERQLELEAIIADDERATTFAQPHSAAVDSRARRIDRVA